MLSYFLIPLKKGNFFIFFHYKKSRCGGFKHSFRRFLTSTNHFAGFFKTSTYTNPTNYLWDFFLQLLVFISKTSAIWVFYLWEFLTSLDTLFLIFFNFHFVCFVWVSNLLQDSYDIKLSFTSFFFLYLIYTCFKLQFNGIVGFNFLILSIHSIQK